MINSQGKHGSSTPWRSQRELCQGIHQTQCEHPGTRMSPAKGIYVYVAIMTTYNILCWGFSAHELLLLMTSFPSRSGLYGFSASYWQKLKFEDS